MHQARATRRWETCRRATVSAALGTCGLFVSRAGATQYDVVTLNTAPFSGGAAYGVYHGTAAGGGAHGALLWTDPDTQVQLNPDGFRSSGAYSVWGNQQVGIGYASVDNNPHALLWTGSAASVVDLTSSPAPKQGHADFTDGAQQVGVAGERATLWSGTPGSYVNLGPSNYSYSEATSVWNGVQVGFGGAVPNSDALLWHGTADSVVVLRTAAQAFGISRGQVVGLAGGNGTNEAALWANAIPDSYVNLAPTGTTASELMATNGVQQVGDVSLGQSLPGSLPGDHHPGVWQGTTSSFQRLPLPNGATEGFAFGIDGDGNIAGVSGTTGAFVPVLWTPNRVPGDVNFDGSVGFDDLVTLASNYGKPGELIDGDLNGDWIVNFTDLVILAKNYGNIDAAAPAYTVSVQVPEPTAVALLAATAVLLTRRRRRQVVQSRLSGQIY